MYQIIKVTMAIFALLSLAACGQKSEYQAPEHVSLVKTMVVGTGSNGKVHRYPGKVSASQKVNLSFQVPGYLIELPIKEGTKVAKGDLLARLDPRDYQIEVDREQAKYHQADITYERYKKLLPSDAISKAQYDEKESLYKLAKAHLAAAQKALADTYMYAPFDGYVAKRYVENYEYVQAKQHVLSLQDISDLEIVVNIPEQDVTRVDDIERLSQEAGKKDIVGYATFASLPEERFPLTVKEAKTEADPKTQTYQVTLLMPAPEKSIILPGMTATVEIKFIASDNQTFLVPVDAITISPQGKYYAWVVDPKKNIVTKKEVIVGEITDQGIQVKSGLNPGETIVVAGVNYLTDGMKIKVIKGRIGH